MNIRSKKNEIVKTKSTSHKSNNTQEKNTRSLWKGCIAFGLINIPVTLISAEKKSTGTHFHLLDKRNLARVRYERINEKNGKTVSWNQIVKGYEYKKENYVILTEQEIKKAAPVNTQTITIENFIKKEEIEPFYYELPYFLLPQKGGIKGYTLLSETLQQDEKIGIATIVLHEKQHLAALIPYQKGLVLNFIRFNNELKKANTIFDFPTVPAITNKEKQIASQLVEILTEKWKPENYHDDFQEVLMKIIMNKIKNGNVDEISTPEVEREESSNVADFMSLLKQSIAATEKKHKTA